MKRIAMLPLAAVMVLVAGRSAWSDEGPDWEKIAAEVKKLGAKVERNPKSKDKEIVGIDLANTKTTDANMERLKDILKGTNEVKWLDLRATKITDNGLAHIRGFTSLKELAPG